LETNSYTSKKELFTEVKGVKDVEGRIEKLG